MNTNHADTVTEYLGSGKLTATPERSVFAPAKVTAEKGCTTFSYGRDGKWRMTSINTYGNHSFVNGEGCDATGYVITDEATMELLDEQF